MMIRPFKAQDAADCFRIRSEAFIRKFYDELGPLATAAGVNAFMPEDYVRMAQTAPFFIAEDDGAVLGFFTVKRRDATTAEIPLIYVDLRRLGTGVGKFCIQFIEKWVISNWPGVLKLLVDTVIPKYNSGFYRKAGFIPAGEAFCDFPDLRVKALRLKKELISEQKITGDHLCKTA